MQTVKTEIIDHILKITLNDPNTLNAMGEQMAEEMLQAMQIATAEQHGLRCLLLTGEGRAFCSGGNLGMMRGDESSTAKSSGVSLGSHHHHVMKCLKNLPYPIVTAVNGPAAGLGFSYALAGDIIVAARSAFFLTAFSNIGVSPDGGLSWTLPRSIGSARAKELLLMGNRLPAQTALEWGLINRVFEDDQFERASLELARELAQGPTFALGVIRRLSWEAWDSQFEQQLDREEAIQLQTFATEDAREGATSLLDKRPPVFKGR